MLDEFFEQIEEARAALGFLEGEECFYRGQPNSEWPLLPSLLRHTHRMGLAGDSVRDLGATLFYEFQARAQELHPRDLSGWNTLFFMRHHGVATRILDWTEVLGVALYFSLYGANESSTPCVWLLNPYALNQHEKSRCKRDLVAPQYLRDRQGVALDYGSYLVGPYPPFGWEQPVALYPIQLSSRLHAQRGYFTIHGENPRSLEEQVSEDVVRKIEIGSPELIRRIKKYLESAGIDTHLLFPDLDGLARYLHEKYSILQSPQANIYGANRSKGHTE